MRILVADDFADTRDMMRVLLEMKGHTVLEAANGREAVEAALSEHPDLILMDVGMPLMDGLAATRCIREQDETAQIPIIAVSALLADDTWRRRAEQSGCTYCCSKPLDFDSLDGMLSVIERMH